MASSEELRPTKTFGRWGNIVLVAMFIVSAAIAAVSTYLSVTESGRSAALGGSSILVWILIGNLGIILVLGAALFVPIWHLLQENRELNGSARLRLRLIALFCIAAMLPTVVVAGFLGVLINRSVEGWFSQKVWSAIESASSVAEATQGVVVYQVSDALKEAAFNLNEPEFVDAFTTDPATYRVSLDAMAQLRSLPTLYILNEQREPVFEVKSEGGPDFVPPSETNWIAAKKGDTVAMDVSEDFVISALMRLNAYDGLYIYAARNGPKDVFYNLQSISEGITAYRDADARQNELKAIFLLSYVEAAILVVFLTAWLGMSAARRIATPIGALATAARSVRDGDLSVRIDRPETQDEIDDLTEAFNQMTMRLSRQTRDLDRARVDAETRSLFIEAVLESVEAGVIRVDSAFMVDVANASAARLLEIDLETLKTASLSDIAPEFLPVMRSVMETGDIQGANLKRPAEEGQRDIHVRMAPENDGAGCVITFHDTTRLAAGQRQAAWRDVARRIAHEIRNPLTPIQLSTERIKRRFGKQIETDKETFDKCIATIQRQVVDIGRMVEEFSNFARMPKPVMSNFDVTELVRNVAFARKMAAPEIDVDVQLPAEKVFASGDERLLGQALTNVIKNACEAVVRKFDEGVKSKGRVTVTLENLDAQARIIIADNGPGFPVEGREKLLEPYVTTRDSGVGLGLAIVNRIIEDHGGALSLSDNQDGGAKVEITLPLLPTLKDNADDPSVGEGVV